MTDARADFEETTRMASEDLTEQKRRVRQARADLIRALVTLGIAQRVLPSWIVKGFETEDDKSGERVLAWFRSSTFNDSLGLLEFALRTWPPRLDLPEGAR